MFFDTLSLSLTFGFDDRRTFLHLSSRAGILFLDFGQLKLPAAHIFLGRKLVPTTSLAFVLVLRLPGPRH